jgi:porin
MKKIALTLLPLTIATAHAADAFDPKGQYLLGDWDGKRTELAQQGIKFEANALIDVAYLADGGREQDADPKVASQYWLGTQLDLEKLAGLDGVTVRAVMTARQGESTSVQDLQDPSAPHMANVQGAFN